MSQNVPWLHQMQTCPICACVINVHASERDAKARRMCVRCSERAIETLNIYCGGAPATALEGLEVMKGFMFQDSIIKMFAQNMHNLHDVNAFRAWWEKGAHGPEIEGARSIDRFMSRVVGEYNVRNAADTRRPEPKPEGDGRRGTSEALPELHESEKERKARRGTFAPQPRVGPRRRDAAAPAVPSEPEVHMQISPSESGENQEKEGMKAKEEAKQSD